MALIGAGGTDNIYGRTAMKNLASGGFEGKIFHVNPQLGIHGDVSDPAGLQHLPDDIDLAVIASPMDAVPRILQGCAKKNMGGAVILSNDGRERHETDKHHLDQIKAIAKETGLRVMGPDSVGVVNTANGLNASAMAQMPLCGNIAFLSQSRDVCSSVLDMAMREHVGFSHVVSLGDMSDVGFADLIDFLGSAYAVSSIVLALESLQDIRNFMSAARAVSRVKPIIALKTGRKGGGGLLHEDDIWDAAFKRAGILRVDEFEALFNCAEFLAKQKQPKGSRLAVISNAAGISRMAEDAMTGHGLKPALFSSTTRKALSSVLKQNWSGTGPVDIASTGLRREYVKVSKICMEAPEVDGILLLSAPAGAKEATSLARELAALLNVSPCPVLTAWVGGRDIDKARAVFNRAGIVTCETPEQAVRTFANLYQYGLNVDMLQQIPVRTDRRLEIDYGTANQVVDSGGALENPVLQDSLARELVTAYGIPAGSEETMGSPDYELVVSAEHHPLFGPVIRFGMGGVLTDVFKDIALGLPPLNRHLARAMIDATRIARVLSGYGAIQKIDMTVLEEILIRVSRLVTDFPQIKHLELNPVSVCNGNIQVAHGRIALEKTRISTPGHLIISPYPFWQQKTITLKTGEDVFIRPVRPSDAQQMIDLFEDLSAETVYLRFFSPIKEISRSMLIRLTQIDYDREIALIAFSGEKESRKIIGVARIIFMPHSRQAEFAIVISDAWQGKGLGIQLLGHALVCTKKYEIDQVWGPVITTNKGMLKMGQKLGFNVRRDIDSGGYKMTIDVGSITNTPGKI